jgi:GTP-binding protein
MKPLVAIVGRPNVGKSTLFNRLIGERRAIVLDIPGVTRDRHYGDTEWGGHSFTVVDTGGFEPEAIEGVVASMREQALMAVEDAAVVIFVVDGREGLLPADEEVAEILRRRTKNVIYAVNKIDGMKQIGLVADFYNMGAGEVLPISAEHGRSVNRLLDLVVEMLPEQPPEPELDESITRIALIGRPNVGKSTLANRLIGQDRMIVDSVAGTTRDAIDLPLMHDDKEYLLIDTAGLRRRRGIRRFSSESFSVTRTIKAIDRCHVAVVMIDAVEGPTEQDARILGLAVDRGRAIVLVVNKWDALPNKETKTAQRFTEQLRDTFNFATFAPVLYMSGLTGQRVHKLMGFVDKVRAAHQTRIGTGPLNRWLELALIKHHPPTSKSKRLRLYYATQVRIAPPTIVLSCNDPEAVHFSYKRYLINQFRESFDVEGTPVRLIFKGKANPFVDQEEEE